MPMATAAKETRGRKGSITRVSWTVIAILPGTRSKPGASVRTSGAAKMKAATTSAPSTAASSVIRRLARRLARSGLPSLSARAYVGTKAEDAREEDEGRDDARAADEAPAAGGVTGIQLDRFRQVR